MRPGHAAFTQASFQASRKALLVLDVPRELLKAHAADVRRDRQPFAPSPSRIFSKSFILIKGKISATCELWSHQLGWELRPEAGGEFLQSQVCPIAG
jgi:hypothetical protein